MQTRHLITLLLAAAPAWMMADEESPLWMRHAALSPDGQEIAFTYKGDIYTVPAQGGTARQLTTLTSFDGQPCWSPTGEEIAFASNREGSMDVFTMPREGGQATRLTTHSHNEYPCAWLDEETVLLRRAGSPTTEDMTFPSGSFYHIYAVSTKGGRQRLWSELTMDDLCIGHGGKALYINVKGYEDTFRKHHTSPITRDVFLWDGASYQQLTTFAGEDRNPVWAPDAGHYFYLSEQDGTLNVYDRRLDGSEKQLTHFKGNPVRYLSCSRDGLLCFCYDGEIYTLRPGSEPQRVSIRILNDQKPQEVVRWLSATGATCVSVSPQGKEIAFVMNGDVYVTSLEYKTTKQITDTPERERTVDFREDGRALVYDSERGGIWSIYQTELTDKDEKTFTYATKMKEECLTDGKTTSFQPAYSPDGKQVAYLENRHTLRVISLSSGKAHTVMDSKWAYSYSDGDQYFTWSPDSKWLLADYLGTQGWNVGDIALVQADGKADPINVTQSGYNDSHPRWAMGGRAMIFQSDRAGYRSHGSWGADRDVYITFFDAEAYDEFRMNKEELALMKEAREEKAKKDSVKDETPKKLTFDLDNLEARTMRLTTTSRGVGDAIMDKEGTKLYYIASNNDHLALWMRDFKEQRIELKRDYIGVGHFNLDKDGNTCYYSDGGIKKIELANGQLKDIPFQAFATHRPQEQQDYLFEHIWRQTREKLYDPNMNGADWERLYHTYRRYLPHINNGYDFSEMASELLGELNVSHTGCRYNPAITCLPTAELGILTDDTHTGPGIRVAEVLKGGPLELEKRIKPGTLITAIDGEPITEGMDYYPLLAGKAGISTRLTVKGTKDEIVIRPISWGQQNELLYKRWVRRCEQLVDKLSGGRLAYVHIRAMNSESFHELYRNLLADRNRQREAVIVDTRHNGGGWLHNDVCALLSGVHTTRHMVRGQHVGNDPYNRWTKPSCMLTCEDCYSNAHGTPWLYKELGIGKLVGAPMAGTMTAVWWENIFGYTFGIPQVGCMDNRDQLLENQTLQPDIECYNLPADILAGRDTQIETAVAHLLKQ